MIISNILLTMSTEGSVRDPLPPFTGTQSKVSAGEGPGSGPSAVCPWLLLVSEASHST